MQQENPHAQHRLDRAADHLGRINQRPDVHRHARLTAAADRHTSTTAKGRHASQRDGLLFGLVTYC